MKRYMYGAGGLKAFAKQLVNMDFLGEDAARFSVVSFATDATTRVPWSYDAAVIGNRRDDGRRLGSGLGLVLDLGLQPRGRHRVAARGRGRALWAGRRARRLVLRRRRRRRRGRQPGGLDLGLGVGLSLGTGLGTGAAQDEWRGLLAAPQWARAAGAGGQPSQPWRVEYGRSAEAEAGEGSEAAIAAHVLTRASSCLSTRRHVACACARACTVQVYVHAQCRCSAGTVHEQFVRSAGAVQVQCRVRFCLSTRCWR